MQITLQNVRIGFPYLFKARPSDDGKEPKFSCMVILDKATQAKLIDQVKTVSEKVAREKFNGKLPSSLKYALRDGSEKEETDGLGEGVMFFNATSKHQPPVVGRKMEPLDGKSGRPYGGCYCNVHVDIYALDNPGDKGGKRVCADLKAVQFVKDGEAFGSGPVDPNEVFKAVAGDDEDTDDVDSLMGED